MSRGQRLLIAYLDRSHLKQYELAKRLGISEPYLSHILNGHRRPKLATVVALERVCGIQPQDWLETDESDSDLATSGRAQNGKG